MVQHLLKLQLQLGTLWQDDTCTNTTFAGCAHHPPPLPELEGDASGRQSSASSAL
jgi:hypothetical protein